MSTAKKIHLEMSVEELVAIVSALRDVCSEIDDDIDFEERIGMPRGEVMDLRSHFVDVLEIHI